MRLSLAVTTDAADNEAPDAGFMNLHSDTQQWLLLVV